MSRLPPVPPANKSAYGPDGAPKTSVDVTHRVLHQAQRARHEDEEREKPFPATAVDDRSTWMLALTGATVAAIVWLLNGRRSEA